LPTNLRNFTQKRLNRSENIPKSFRGEGYFFETLCTDRRVASACMYVFERLCAIQMNLTTTNNSVNLDSYNVNGEWKVLWTEAKRMEFPYASLPNEMFSNVAFTIKLRRRHLFYVINVTTSFFLRRHARDVMFSTSSTSSRLLTSYMFVTSLKSS